MADIELVIKISEEIYNHLLSRYKYQNIDDTGLSELDKVGVAIKNGTPLPNGHGRLIDADALIFNADYYEPLISKRDFDFAPTIIEAAGSDENEVD